MPEPLLCVTPTSLRGVLIIRPRRLHDRRGFFAETYNKRALSSSGITVDFVQDNLSFSPPMYTLRDLHFQKEPFAQAKLVNALAGAVLDVVI
jgi:dTDP-4-dehydrorhamnose 3,5-epimerase